MGGLDERLTDYSYFFWSHVGMLCWLRFVVVDLLLSLAK